MSPVEVAITSLSDDDDNDNDDDDMSPIQTPPPPFPTTLNHEEAKRLALEETPSSTTEETKDTTRRGVGSVKHECQGKQSEHLSGERGWESGFHTTIVLLAGSIVVLVFNGTCLFWMDCGLIHVVIGSPCSLLTWLEEPFALSPTSAFMLFLFGNVVVAMCWVVVMMFVGYRKIQRDCY